MTTFKLLKDIGGAKGMSNEEFQASWPKDAPEVDLVINSCGGSCVEGIAIAEFLRSQKAKGQVINAKIQGFCGSITTLIAAACTTSEISPFSQYFVHEARLNIADATSADLASAQAEVDTFNGIMRQAYMDKTKLPESEIAALMSSSTMMTAQKAVELGFVDKVTGLFKAVARFVRHKPEAEGHIFISINQAEESPGAIQNSEAEQNAEEEEDEGEEMEEMRKQMAVLIAERDGLKTEVDGLKTEISAKAEAAKKGEAMAKKLGEFVPPPKPAPKGRPAATGSGNHLTQLY